MNESSTWLDAPLPGIAILGTAFLILFIAERWVPLRAPRSALAGRLAVNVCVSALALATAYLVVAPAAVAALREVSLHRMGVLQWIALPEAAEVAVGFALMDLSFYYWHMANHKIRFLWRFHNVHHIDPDLDVTAASLDRFAPGIHLPLQTVTAAVAELERAAGMGLRPAVLPDAMWDRPYHLSEWEPLWEALA